jgi:hypothetical protein
MDHMDHVNTAVLVDHGVRTAPPGRQIKEINLLKDIQAQTRSGTLFCRQILSVKQTCCERIHSKAKSVRSSIMS